MDLPIDKKEFDEIVDALCSEHVDPRKREYRDKLYSKMKLLQQIMNDHPFMVHTKKLHVNTSDLLSNGFS